MSDQALTIYLREISKFPTLSHEEERRLIEKMNRGSSSARDSLILRHLQTVVKVAKLYQGKGVPLSDLIDEGNMGLLKALKAYDLSKKGVRFISYASWWIRHYIQNIIYRQSRIVKVPMTRIASRKSIREIEEVLTHKFGRLPSIEEMAEVLELSPHEIHQAMEVAQSDFSLDLQLGEQEVSLLDFVRAEPEKLEDEVVKCLLVGELKEHMGKLTPNEQLVLKLRLGLDGEARHKLREIGDILGLSRERVRQIETKALEKLREMLK